MEETEGTNAAHGEAGVPYVDAAKKNIGLPEGEKWYVSEGTRDFFKDVQAKNKANYDEWQSTYKAWKEANPDLAKQLEDSVADNVMPVEDMIKEIDAMGTDAESTRNYINEGGNFGAGFDKAYGGKNLYFGIREHA